MQLSRLLLACVCLSLAAIAQQINREVQNVRAGERPQSEKAKKDVSAEDRIDDLLLNRCMHGELGADLLHGGRALRHYPEGPGVPVGLDAVMGRDFRASFRVWWLSLTMMV